MTFSGDKLEEQANSLLREFELEKMAEAAARPQARLSGLADPRNAFGGIVPEGVLSYVEGIARTKEIQLLVLERVHEVVCRRLPTGIAAEMAARERWGRAWRFKPEQLRQRLGRARDEAVRNAHFGSTAVPSRLAALPKKYVFAPSKQDRTIRVSDPASPPGDIGHAAYLEHTPGEVVCMAHRAWERRNSTRKGPDVWDITAGSGTVAEYLTLLGKGRCVSSDVVVVRDDVLPALAQQAGRLVEHTSRRFIGDVSLRIARPDLIFFDPPSLGTPTHTTIYEGAARDLASLSVEEWLAEVGWVVRRCVGRLASGGILSLLVRAGRRRGPTVEPLPEMTEALLVFLGSPEVELPRVQVLARHDVIYSGHRVNQAGLGQSRVPTTHLLLGRPS